MSSCPGYYRRALELPRWLLTPLDDSSSSARPDAAQLSADLLAATLRQVARHYEDLNLSLFGGQLRRPVLGWTSGSRVLGSWIGGERSLFLSTVLIDRGWGQLVEVLKHEMAHQFVDEVLAIGQEGPHGPTFRKVCADRGIDAAATGASVEHPPPGQVEQPEVERLLRKIHALLSLAQSDNQHEAELAMTQARRLMLRHNLKSIASSTGNYSYRHLGEPTGRRMAWQRALSNLLSEFFFVEIIIVPVYRPREGKRGSVLEACGTPANLELAEYVYDFLVTAGENLWKAHRKKHRLKANRDRQSFLYGVMSGFSAKLTQEAQRNEKEGLVWVGDPELSTYFRRRHPHVRSVSGRSQVSRDAYFAGHEAGRRIVLHRGMKAGQSASTPKLLRGALARSGKGGRV